jgi:hypothetical protein
VKIQVRRSNVRELRNTVVDKNARTFKSDRRGSGLSWRRVDLLAPFPAGSEGADFLYPYHRNKIFSHSNREFYGYKKYMIHTVTIKRRPGPSEVPRLPNLVKARRLFNWSGCNAPSFAVEQSAKISVGNGLHMSPFTYLVELL